MKLGKALNYKGGLLTMEGTFKFFNAKKGYGFIVTDDNKDLFDHITNMSRVDFIPQKGDRVEFGIESTAKGAKAINVKKV